MTLRDRKKEDQEGRDPLLIAIPLIISLSCIGTSLCFALIAGDFDMFSAPMDINAFTAIVVICCFIIASVLIMRADPTMPYLQVVILGVATSTPFSAAIHMIAGMIR